MHTQGGISDHAFSLLSLLLDKGLLAILAVVVGFWLKKWQDDRLSVIGRQLIPRAELDLHCTFYGPEQGEFLVEVTIRVKNKGNTRRKFKSMFIRLRGINAGQPLTFWSPERKERVNFPIKLVEDDLLFGKPGDYYYVEPQIEQVFTYVTKISADVRFVLAHLKLTCELEANEDSYENTFTEERMFEVPRT